MNSLHPLVQIWYELICCQKIENEQMLYELICCQNRRMNSFKKDSFNRGEKIVSFVNYIQMLLKNNLDKDNSKKK